MSSKQTRRSISVSGALYDKLKAYCDEHGDSMSNFVEARCREFFKMEPRATPPKELPSTDRKTTTEVRLTSSTLSEKSNWVPAIELPARVEKIKEVVEAKKVLTPEQEAASKIFTF